VAKWIESYQRQWMRIAAQQDPHNTEVPAWAWKAARYLGTLADPIGYDKFSFTPRPAYVDGFGAGLRAVWDAAQSEDARQQATSGRPGDSDEHVASSTAPGAQATTPRLPPKPDQAIEAAYVADLEAIDPDIVHGKPDKAVNRGRNQCLGIAEWPEDQTRLIDRVQKRFTSPSHPHGFGPNKSAQILAVVRKHLYTTS
jgi:hypothetical protein